jgi:hypothetical protein
MMDLSTKNMCPLIKRLVELELWSDYVSSWLCQPGVSQYRFHCLAKGSSRPPPKYVTVISDKTFGGLAHFLSGNTPNQHGGFIDKNMFQILKDSKIGAMLKLFFWPALPARASTV